MVGWPQVWSSQVQRQACAAVLQLQDARPVLEGAEPAEEWLPPPAHGPLTTARTQQGPGASVSQSTGLELLLGSGLWAWEMALTGLRVLLRPRLQLQFLLCQTRPRVMCRLPAQSSPASLLCGS